MSDPICKELLEKKPPQQYGSMADMLTLDPRIIVDGHAFYNSSNNQLYIAVPVTQSVSRHIIIREVRSGNFQWQAITWEEEEKTYKRKEDVLRHAKTAVYPDEQIMDEFDCMVSATENLTVDNEQARKTWAKMLDKDAKPLEVLEEAMGKKVDPTYLKQVEGKNWMQGVLVCMYEQLFLSWLVKK